MKSFVFFLLIPIKMFGLYYADILSDILQTVSLYNNCHSTICALSVGIILLSYVITTVYIKFTENLMSSKAFLYPWLFEWVYLQYITFYCNIDDCNIVQNTRGKARKHIVNSWNALVKGKETPAVPPKDERFHREVSFIEATTESISQFTLGNAIIRIFGVSDNPTSKVLQYFSLATSFLSLAMAFVTVSTWKHRSGCRF